MSLKTGLIGAGVFGGYHAGKIAESQTAEFIGVFDPDAARSSELANKHGVKSFASQADLFDSADAVIIVCPATYHADTVEAALGANCHVLVEKPLALSGEAAKTLAAQADAAELVLQVGHQERLVLKAMGLFDLPETPVKIEAWRESPPAPTGRAGDVSVIFDLMIHDLDMVACLMGRASSVEGQGAVIHSGHIDTATATLGFGEGSRAIVTSSRAAENRRRGMRLAFKSGEIEIDFLTRDVRNTTPFEVRADVSRSLPDPLGAADHAFFAACLGKGPVLVPGREAVEAVRVAEVLETTIKTNTGA
ncbi:gfo/Idh/MocA family oxidoreductase [Henriciella barbarensis]|uniref:Gfo/Idh/MocA family oxidoreductase n=1 Tax=Henriciella barbarensis TaxID=86342 RepID=A0A399QX56_9PROT|nr:Gfo/Idh/MocA family oxidoreductase [Henriciella barbarensis]RIJ22097.1 gfo/Idh/MocA family oxidoreductase [Henriciella barbarensis]